MLAKKKKEDFKRDSDESQKFLEKSLKDAQEVALKIFIKKSEDSANGLISLTKFDDPDSSSAASVRFNAIRHHFKLLKLEVDKTELSGKDGADLGVVILPALKPVGAA